MSASATLELIPDMIPETPIRAIAPRGLDRIVLTGFMGSGKTTAGGLLAESLDWRFADLDREVERRDGRTVAAIFAEDGETYFRKLETAALASLLGERNLVLALGGGAPEDLGNRLLLEQTPRTAIVYLAAPLQVMVDRCRHDATGRPLLDEADALFEHRSHIYTRIASHKVETARLNAAEVASTILDALQTPAKR